MEGRRESKTLVLLSLLALGGGIIVLAASSSPRATSGLLSPYSGLWLIATLAALVSLIGAAGANRFSVQRFAPSGTVGVAPVTAMNHLHRQHNLIPGVMPPQESFSLPTLQTSTCICVNHQPLQRMNREEGLATAPATIILLPVLHGPRPCRAAVADCNKSFSRERVLARLFHGPP